MIYKTKPKKRKVKKNNSDPILDSYSSEKLDKLIKTYSEFDDAESVKFIKQLKYARGKK